MHSAGLKQKKFLMMQILVKNEP